MFLVHTERKKGVRASGLLFGYWLLCFLLPATSAAQLASQGVSGSLGNRCGSFRPWVALPPSFLLPFPHMTYCLHRDTHHGCLNSSDTQAHSLTQVYASSHMFLWTLIPRVLHT